MSNKTVDNVLDNYYAPIKLPDINRNGLKQALYDLLASNAEPYIININRSDGYEVTEQAVPLETIKDIFGIKEKS